MNRNVIARVNYLDFISTDPEKKSRFIQEFGDSFANMGFAIVANHGVPADLKSDLFDAAKSFFALDEETKKKYENMQVNGQRGYISKNRESAKGQKVPDLKEFFHVGQEFEKALLDELHYPENIWVDECPELKRTGLSVFETFSKTGRDLLRAIALYLDLEENYFDDKIQHGNSILRLLHYYPLSDVSNIPPGAVRAAAHGDINLITLLMGGSAEGLQAQTLEGEWIDVSPAEDEIVINIGDMLERLTNGKLRSTQHRVVNPTNLEKLKQPRYSTPFFLHPNSEMDLSCLENCVDSEHPKGYEDISAGAFLDERLRELGLKK
jgi:isopenicillin N synthase-like dioxygenase